MKTKILLIILLLPFLLQEAASSTTASTTEETTTETTTEANSQANTAESTAATNATTETTATTTSTTESTTSTTESTTPTAETPTTDSATATTTESTSIQSESTVTTTTTGSQETTTTPEMASSATPTETTVIDTTPSTMSTTESATSDTTTNDMTTTYDSTSVTPSSTYSESSMSITTGPTTDSSNETTNTSNTSDEMTSTDSTMTSTITPSSVTETEASTSASVTTTTPTTTTTTSSIPDTGLVNIKEDSAVINVVLPNIRLNVSNNAMVKDVATKLKEKLKGVNGFKGVLVTKISNGARRKRRDTNWPSYKITILMDAFLVLSNSTEIGDQLKVALESVADVNQLNLSLSNMDACSTDVCLSRLARLNGYLCRSNTLTCKFKHVCSGVSCGENGVCYAEIFKEQFNYTAACSCKSETFYYYDGKNCTEKVMKWELALAIAGGVGGALVLILLFIVICVCARLKRGSDDFSDSSEIMFGDALTKHKKRDFRSGAGNGNSGPLMTYPGSQMYDNNAYYEDMESSAPSGGNNRQSGEWNPEKSANTYAKIESKLQETNYSMLIKRPQVSTEKRFSAEVTNF